MTQHELRPADEQHALHAAEICLRDCRHPRVVALHDQIHAAANPSPESAAMSKLDGEVGQLQKADPNLSRAHALQRAIKANPRLASEVSAATHGPRVSA